MNFHRLNSTAFKLIIFLLIGLGSAYFRPHQTVQPPGYTAQPVEGSGFTDPSIIKAAFDNQRSNFQVKQSGRIIKILREDKYGARHQRFIVQINSGQKLLIAHNLELAPRIDNLKEGEFITFYGEYEWNNKGGVIHWTHHDPKRRHPDGWLSYNNRIYQ